MRHNIKKNRAWLVTSLETLVMGVLFVLLAGIEPPPFFSVAMLTMADDPPFGILMIIVGVFGLIVSLWNLHFKHAFTFMVTSLTGVWAFYATLFVLNDINGPASTPSIITVFSVSIVIRISIELWGGDKQ